MCSEIPEIFKSLLEHPFSVTSIEDNVYSHASRERLGKMATELVSVTMDEGTSTLGDFPVILKKIIEIPPPNLLEGDDENDKGKLLGDDLDFGGVGGMGPSAALTPAIWDKTIPYDSETFHLEYMDLEEFLIENGISSTVDEGQQKKPVKESSQTTIENPCTSSTDKTTPAAPISLLTVMELDQCEEEVVTITASSSTEDTSDDEPGSPDPINPDDIEVEVNFQPDPTDLVLSSVPGGELFNPRKHRFSEEDLKPQPMIKKAKKVYVPEEKKDEKYWQRRNKNNVAAKRSRDARRLKENQITVRAAFLERENLALRQEVAELRKDFGRYKNVASRYEAKYGPLEPTEEL